MLLQICLGNTTTKIIIMSVWVWAVADERKSEFIILLSLKRRAKNIYIYYNIIYTPYTYIHGETWERLGEYLNRGRVYPVKSTSTKGENKDPELSTRLVSSRRFICFRISLRWTSIVAVANVCIYCASKVFRFPPLSTSSYNICPSSPRYIK